MKPFDRKEARRTLVDVYPILSPYFALAHGTALGAYRDKDFTPTEVDIDLLTTIDVMKEEAPSIVKALESLGFSIRLIQSEKPNQTRFTRAFSAKRNGIKIDCAGYTVKILRNSYPDQCLTDGFVVGYSTSTIDNFSIVHPFPLLLRSGMDTIDFQGLPWKIPSPEEYLEREYGKDWRTPKPNHHIQESRIYNFETLEGIK